jgi:hypothetical protein
MCQDAASLAVLRSTLAVPSAVVLPAIEYILGPDSHAFAGDDGMMCTFHARTRGAAAASSTTASAAAAAAGTAAATDELYSSAEHEQSAVSPAAGVLLRECEHSGMLRASFAEDGKLDELELVFDAISLYNQVCALTVYTSLVWMLQLHRL